jgi:hypothetical protein
MKRRITNVLDLLIHSGPILSSFGRIDLDVSQQANP